MRQNVLDFTFAWRFSADCRVAQDTIVECLLGLASLFARVVLAQCNAVIQVQMEMLQRSMLNAQRAQCRSINLSRQILQEQPSREAIAVAVAGISCCPAAHPIVGLTRHWRAAIL